MIICSGTKCTLLNTSKILVSMDRLPAKIYRLSNCLNFNLMFLTFYVLVLTENIVHLCMTFIT